MSDRARLRDLGIIIGEHGPGPLNAITDVPGIWVGHKTLILDEPRVARTGVTVVVPRENRIHEDYAYAGYFSFNGNGEMTGLPWLEESGMLGSPVAITNTHQVGLVRDGLVRYAVDRLQGQGFFLPVVAETYDGWLNDIGAFHLSEQDLFDAMDAAEAGPVAEGNVGGGTGMICHDLKGGIGTSSRRVAVQDEHYTVGALVQANYGERRHLRVNGVPVGLALTPDVVPVPFSEPGGGSSIIVVLATDAPLLPFQCKRLARRATVGLARVGGMGHNGSGDIFIAFATGNHIPASGEGPVEVSMLPNHLMDILFEAAAEAVEESILNALTAAQTISGYRGRTAYALPLQQLQALVHPTR